MGSLGMILAEGIKDHRWDGRIYRNQRSGGEGNSCGGKEACEFWGGCDDLGERYADLWMGCPFHLQTQRVLRDLCCSGTWEWVLQELILGRAVSHKMCTWPPPSFPLSHFLKTLTRAYCWQSHTQKSNLIIDAIIPWIPSLAAANGWCVKDSIRALIGPL